MAMKEKVVQFPGCRCEVKRFYLPSQSSRDMGNDNQDVRLSAHQATLVFGQISPKKRVHLLSKISWVSSLLILY